MPRETKLTATPENQAIADSILSLPDFWTTDGAQYAQRPLMREDEKERYAGSDMLICGIRYQEETSYGPCWFLDAETHDGRLWTIAMGAHGNRDGMFDAMRSHIDAHSVCVPIHFDMYMHRDFQRPVYTVSQPKAEQFAATRIVGQSSPRQATLPSGDDYSDVPF